MCFWRAGFGEEGVGGVEGELGRAEETWVLDVLKKYQSIVS